jgi:hypothetical protein
MTTLDVKAGICGYYARIHAVKRERQSVTIMIESDCENVAAFSKILNQLTIKDIFRHPFNENAIYEQAGQCGLHPACPVPCGVIKAAEVELGLALKMDVTFKFQH